MLDCTYTVEAPFDWTLDCTYTVKYICWTLVCTYVGQVHLLGVGLHLCSSSTFVGRWIALTQLSTYDAHWIALNTLQAHLNCISAIQYPTNAHEKVFILVLHFRVKQLLFKLWKLLYFT